MKKIIFLFVFIITGSISNLKAQCVSTPGQVSWSAFTNFNNVYPDTSDLFVLDNFPNTPFYKTNVGNTSSPINYTDYFATLMRGYIYVPSTATYQFNVTADDKGIFYLSTNESIANKRKLIETTTWTAVGEHYKSPSQNSINITLNPGVNYYFELYGFEGAGGDHANVYWRKVGATDTTWRLIDFNFLKDYGCNTTCAPRGTACNDNNPSTTNDQQDGHCNCVGKINTANACVGDRSKIDAYYYDNISGDYVEPDLISNARFPLQPHRKEALSSVSGPLAPYTKDTYGSYVQGYITVPVTGQYSFNITGDNQTIFYLSKNDSVQYKQTSQAIAYWGVDETAHNVNSFQTVGPILLEKNKYYYYEIRHKENSWRDHFNLYWKAPFINANQWKRVPAFYTFDYNCEIACVPAGTPCDDGNPNTNNDVYNGSCQCVGTPCSGPACNDVVGQFTPQAECNCTDNVLPFSEHAWETCANAPNPNPARASFNRWIRYDFGEPYLINGTRIWNYNVTGDTDKGFRQVYIDYSQDGNTWTSLPGTYTWPQASGTSDYSGFLGPNFNGTKMRYMLFSAANNHGDASCSGFSKITFNAQLCNPLNTLCDDDDPLTIHDKFDNNCNCAGVKIECAQNLMALGTSSLLDTTYKAIQHIESANKVNNNQDVSFSAGNSIVFLPGFEVKNSAVFKAEIKNCLQAAYVENQNARKAFTSDSTALAKMEEEENPAIKRVMFKLEKPSKVHLAIYKDGNLHTEILNEHLETSGTISKIIPTQLLPEGLYQVKMSIDGREMMEEFRVRREK
jgi:hypothetical protein